MVELVATFSGLTRFFQQTVHGANGAVILPFIEQRGIDSGWRAILEAFGVKMRPGPFRVLPAAVRVPAKVATRAPPEKKRHVFPGNTKREAQAECGKQRWCPRPPQVR